MNTALTQYDLAEFLPEAEKKLCKDCVLVAAPDILPLVKINLSRAPGIRSKFRIIVSRPDFKGKLRLSLGPGQGTIQIDTAGPANLDVRTWRQVSLAIGRGTTINNAKIVCDNADVTVGEDGLWSGDILIQSNDQHGIVDLETMKIINRGRRHIHIGNHVWIGRRTMVMPDVNIGSGSILAAGAIVTTDIPDNSIFAGVPARKVRDNVTWSRAPNGFSEAEYDLLGIAERADERDRGR